jgi:hypothetical protein
MEDIFMKTIKALTLASMIMCGIVPQSYAAAKAVKKEMTHKSAVSSKRIAIGTGILAVCLLTHYCLEQTLPDVNLRPKLIMDALAAGCSYVFLKTGVNLLASGIAGTKSLLNKTKNICGSMYRYFKPKPGAKENPIIIE